MKRQKHRKTKSRKNRQAGTRNEAAAPNKVPDKIKKSDRRQFITTLSNMSLIAAAVGGGGWFFIGEVCAATREADLERIGNGIPAVVQIHDPECSTCLALQREVREAMSNFDENELQYLVANIRSTKGRRLADEHRVSHITLLLFDADGKRRRILAGLNSSSYLESVFRAHLARSSRR